MSGSYQISGILPEAKYQKSGKTLKIHMPDSLRPCDGIYCRRYQTRSTVVHVMAWCLFAAYLVQKLISAKF